MTTFYENLIWYIKDDLGILIKNGWQIELAKEKVKPIYSDKNLIAFIKQLSDDQDRNYWYNCKRIST